MPVNDPRIHASQNDGNATADEAIQLLSGQVRMLQEASRGLMDAMEEQISAIISSDAEAMEQCTENNVTSQQRFFKAEQELIGALTSCIPAAEQKERGVSFETLKKLHPGLSARFQVWKQQISDDIDRLQRKQGQLVELLEFAQSQNAAMMRSFYGLQSETHTHYRHNGEKTGVMSGMAVNQEG